MPDNEFVVRIVDGCERHLTQAQLDRLARITATAYETLLDENIRFRYDGQGNCWLVAAVAHGAAMAIGLPSRMYGGQVFGETGAAIFPNGHYWTVVNKGVVVESPNTPTILIWPRSSASLAGKRAPAPARDRQKRQRQHAQAGARPTAAQYRGQGQIRGRTLNALADPVGGCSLSCRINHRRSSKRMS